MEIFASNVVERVHLQVAQQIRRMITQDKLKPGDPLPSYDELCETFNVSPVTLKRALDELYKQRLIFSRRGKGLFVNKLESAPRKLGLIGLIYSFSHQTFFSSAYLMEIFQGIMLEADVVAAGVRAFSIKATHKRESRIVGPEDLIEAGVDGAILIAVHNREFLSRFTACSFPVASVDNLEHGVPAHFMVVDNQLATQRAVEALRAAGHRNIAYLDGWTTDDVLGDDRRNPIVESSDVIERREAYNAVMRAAGQMPLVIPNRPSGQTGGDVEAMRAAAANWAGMKDRPTAVLAYGVDTAAQFIQELKTRNVQVPGDVSVAAVAGSRNLPGDQSFIACNRVNFVDMGREAVRHLHKSCNGKRLKEAKVTRIGSDYSEGGSVRSL